MSAVAEVLRFPDEIQCSSFLKHAPAGFALCQSPGNITCTNSVFNELLGLSSSPIPVTLADLIQPEDGCDSRRFVAELFRGTRESFQVECSVSGDLGKSRRWTVWAVRGKNCGPEFAVVMLEDLTGAAAAQRRLQQAERLETIGPRLQQFVDRSFAVLRSTLVGRWSIRSGQEVCGRNPQSRTAGIWPGSATADGCPIQ
jgi:PAS domain-containing protein